jgi:formylglycine-generating enzyme required for sulfatase activity
MRDVGILPRNPVEQVSWEDAVGAQGWLPRYGLRLPTEAEWEYASRAPFDREGRRDDTYVAWSVGSDPARLGEVARYATNSEGRPWPVGLQSANRFGLHDMHGNVYEWCQDKYNRVSHAAWPPADGKPPLDPVADVGLGTRVCRGGCSVDGPELLRSAFRNHMSPDARNHLMGIRPARSLER